MPAALQITRVYTSFITPDGEVLGFLCSRVYPRVLSKYACALPQNTGEGPDNSRWKHAYLTDPGGRAV